MGLPYCSGIGELLWAVSTCRPDLCYASVRSSQHSVCPAREHYHGLRHSLKYMYVTRDDGIYFWRAIPNEKLPAVPPQAPKSNRAELLLDGRPNHDALSLHAFMDSEWGSCPRTRRSMGGGAVRLAGGPVAYKTKLQPTVSGSSTESEFIQAHDTGKMVLYTRSIMYDLGIPQRAATVMYEDNEACITMAMAQKSTPRTRHIDIRYFALAEWVERDLMALERVSTKQNMAD